MLVFGIRPQSDGKGIQASMLVTITRLKPRGLTSPGERRNRPLLSAWGLRLTHITIAVDVLAQAPDLGDCWARGQLKKQLEMISAEHARCDGKYLLIE